MLVQGVAVARVFSRCSSLFVVTFHFDISDGDLNRTARGRTNRASSGSAYCDIGRITPCISCFIRNIFLQKVRSPVCWVDRLGPFASLDGQTAHRLASWPWLLRFVLACWLMFRCVSLCTTRVYVYSSFSLVRCNWTMRSGFICLSEGTTGCFSSSSSESGSELSDFIKGCESFV